MPELPEVETTLRAIEKFTNSSIKEVKIHNRNLRWKVDKKFESLLVNQKIINLDRRAKYIIFYLDDVNIILHLGMSGSLRIANNKENYFLKHDHAEFIFENESIIYNDPRRFGSLHITENVDEHRLICNLGPEPLSKNFNKNQLFELCKNSKTNIKSLIMNQKNVVGIGNIYANEILFRAGIRPEKKVSNIKFKSLKLIINSAKEILLQSINKGGTTIKDHKQPDGKLGYFKQNLQVYGRDDQQCRKCSNNIKLIVISNRSTFFCGKCQK